MPAIKHPVKINVDLGEGYGNFKCGPDEELIPLIDHANVACGFHAGYGLQKMSWYLHQLTDAGIH